ncbi:MAG: hypothetical protein HOH04_08685 [Rhodospirillaceae bacterium]|nr:hypothetical protein [Rhodospirillaceae bacterium]
MFDATPPLAAHGLHGLQALAAQGLHGLQADFAAHGLHGLQAFFAAQGLHGLHAFFAAQGLQGLQAFLAAQGLHGLQAASSMTCGLGLAIGSKPAAALPVPDAAWAGDTGETAPPMAIPAPTNADATVVDNNMDLNDLTAGPPLFFIPCSPSRACE